MASSCEFHEEQAEEQDITLLLYELLWGRLRQIGVSPRMLAAVQSLYATGTLAMNIDGTAGQPAVQHMGVRQGCPLSPTLFGIFFDGLHDFLLAWAPAVGMQLRSGRWVSSLVYADDVVLLSWRRRRKFTTSIQPAKAYEDESVIMSGPH